MKKTLILNFCRAALLVHLTSFSYWMVFTDFNCYRNGIITTLGIISLLGLLVGIFGVLEHYEIDEGELLKFKT